MTSGVGVVAELVGGIEPFDRVEREHVEDTLRWLGSTEDVYRRVKPDVPARHLVAYVVVVDPGERVVLLGRHVLAGLWLPMGGHVEVGEHPLAAARREAAEELGIEAEFDVVGAGAGVLDGDHDRRGDGGACGCESVVCRSGGAGAGVLGGSEGVRVGAVVGYRWGGRGRLGSASR